MIDSDWRREIRWPGALGAGLLQSVVAALHLKGCLAECFLQPAQGRFEVPVPRLPKTVGCRAFPERAGDLAPDRPRHLPHLDAISVEAGPQSLHLFEFGTDHRHGSFAFAAGRTPVGASILQDEGGQETDNASQSAGP